MLDVLNECRKIRSWQLCWKPVLALAEPSTKSVEVRNLLARWQGSLEDAKEATEKEKEVVVKLEKNQRAGNQVFLLFAPLLFWFCNSEIGNFYVAAEFSFRFVSCSMDPGSGKARNLSRQSGKERQ